MERRLERNFLAFIALLATCGCLSVLVLFGGVGAYFILSEMGFSGQELGLPEPVSPADDPLWLETVPPNESVSGVEPLVTSSPEAELMNAQAEKECRPFASALSAYKLVSWSKSGNVLTCGFSSDRKIDSSYAVVIGIQKFSTPAEARQQWETDWGLNSNYATYVAKDSQSFPDRWTYSHEGDRFFAAYRDNPENGITTYDVTAGLLYQDSLVKFYEPAALDSSTTNWDAVQQLAKQNIDQKSAP